jgi:putative ABC transport system ATP-binding protein
MIRFKGVGMRFNRGKALEVRALREINLEITKGQFVTMIGSNGSGKTTLLNVLTGDVRPTKGKVYIDDINVSHCSKSKRASLVSRVFQSTMMGTCADLNIEENLALALSRGSFRGLGWPIREGLRKNLQHWLARLGLGLEKRLKDTMGSLSVGQRQAVSFLMAILAPMKILALDGHTSSLDPKMAEFVMRITSNIVQERKLTALMSTHSMHQALEVGDRTLMLHDGLVVFDVSGKERSDMTVSDLLKVFKDKSGEAIDENALLFK